MWGVSLLTPGGTSTGARVAAQVALDRSTPLKELRHPHPLARIGLSPRSDVRRLRHQLRPLQRGRRARRAVPVHGPWQGDALRADRGRRLRLARLPAADPAGSALRLPRARALRPGQRRALQPEQAAARPLRQGHRRRHRLGPVAVRLHLRRRELPQRRRLRRAHDQGRRDQPVLRLGGRPAAVDPLQRDVHLRGARQGADPPAPRRPRGAARDVRRPGAPGRHRAPQPARGHRDRADAGAPVHPGQRAARQGAAELLGLQHPRLPGAARGVRRRTTAAGQQVQEFKAMVKAMHVAGHRGHPRRGLQPHRGGQPPRPDAELQGHRQRRLLPPRRRRQALLHGLHGHRELPQRPAPALAAADHGLAALLGHRDARRRLPLRPRLHPGARVLRRRPAVHLLRARAAGPGGEPGQADRRAVGRRAGRLPGRQLPAAVDRVEREVPRHRPRLLARRADARGVRQPARRLLRPLRAVGPPAVREHQLRHRPRRLHAARPRVLQREAQRGQRRERQRRREPQPVLEPRRRGSDRRHRGARAARPRPAQLHHHAAAQPGRPDAAARRRARPHAGGQQQHLRPGQRAQLGPLGPGRRSARRVHLRGVAPAGRAPDVPPEALLHRHHRAHRGHRRR